MNKQEYFYALIRKTITYNIYRQYQRNKNLLPETSLKFASEVLHNILNPLLKEAMHFKSRVDLINPFSPLPYKSTHNNAVSVKVLCTKFLLFSSWPLDLTSLKRPLISWGVWINPILSVFIDTPFPNSLDYFFVRSNFYLLTYFIPRVEVEKQKSTNTNILAKK